MSARGDKELADVMRKLVKGGVFISYDAPAKELTIEDTTVSVTEEELQAVEEVAWAE